MQRDFRREIRESREIIQNWRDKKISKIPMIVMSRLQCKIRECVKRNNRDIWGYVTEQLISICLQITFTILVFLVSIEFLWWISTMNRQRNSDQNSSTPYRRTSLNSTRNESSSNSTPRNVQTNRSDSAIDVRTPVQQRLKRLQSNLREEQLRKANLSATATTPMTTTNNNQRQSLPARLPAHVPSPPSPVEMMVMSPPKKQLKRRSDFNQNDVQSVKKYRFDKSPSPIKSSERKIASRHSFPKVQESHKYENDIEMTDATIQEEVRWEYYSINSIN